MTGLLRLACTGLKGGLTDLADTDCGSNCSDCSADGCSYTTERRTGGCLKNH